MRLSFVRAARPVYLGGRSFGAGPHRIRWGGKWYEVAPITLWRVLQLGSLITELGGEPLVMVGLEALPPQVQRVLAPLLIDGQVRELDLQRATAGQLAGLMEAFLEVNDWKAISRLISPPKDAPVPRSDESAFDRSVVTLGKEFGLWPHDILGKPFVEVQAVIDALAYNQQEGGEPSEDTAALVRKMSAEREASRA